MRWNAVIKCRYITDDFNIPRGIYYAINDIIDTYYVSEQSNKNFKFPFTLVEFKNGYKIVKWDIRTKQVLWVFSLTITLPVFCNGGCKHKTVMKRNEWYTLNQQIIFIKLHDYYKRNEKIIEKSAIEIVR